MADTQQQYRGAKAKLPTLLEGQLGFCTDTTELYIGSTAGNVLVGSGAFAQAISDIQTDMNDKLSASQAEAVATLADTAELAAVITGLNNVINSLKTAGIMK